MIVMAAHSDRTGERRRHVAASASLAAFGLLASTFAPDSGALARGALSIAAMGLYSYHAAVLVDAHRVSSRRWRRRPALPSSTRPAISADSWTVPDGMAAGSVRRLSASVCACWQLAAVVVGRAGRHEPGRRGVDGGQGGTTMKRRQILKIGRAGGDVGRVSPRARRRANAAAARARRAPSPRRRATSVRTHRRPPTSWIPTSWSSIRCSAASCRPTRRSSDCGPARCGAEGPAWSGQGRYLVWSDIPEQSSAALARKTTSA